MRRTRQRARLTLFQYRLIAFFLLSSVHAWAQQAHWTATLDGAFKSIAQYERLRQLNLYSTNDLALAEQRLRLDTTLSREWFRVELADQVSFIAQQDNPTSIPVPKFYPTQAYNWDWQAMQTSTLSLLNHVERAYVQLTFNQLEVRLGRQVVAIGVGKIFNGVSQIPHWPLTYIDSEYPVTSDAASVIWNGPLGIEGRYFPRLPGYQKDSFHLRAKGSKHGYDLALTAGRSFDKDFVGIEMAGNFNESLLRGELIGYNWQNQDDAQALLGFDRVFSKQLSLQAELFYNGFGQSSGYQLTPFPQPSTPLRGIWYFGENFVWDVTARLKASVTSVINLEDPSALFQFLIDYSLSANTEVELGQYLNWGSSSTSEFGGLLSVPVLTPVLIQVGSPDITYLLFKWYF